MKLCALIILNTLAINHLCAMESPQLDEQMWRNNLRVQLLEQGYIASQNIATDLKLPEEIFENLNAYLDTQSKSKASLNYVPGNLDEYSTVIKRNYKLMESTIEVLRGEVRIFELEKLALHLKTLLPPADYFFSAFLVSDKAGVVYSEPVELSWHQDKFNGASSMSQFDFLFFMILDEYNFSNSHLGLGLIHEAAFEQSEEMNTASNIKEEYVDSVKLLAAIKSKKWAGYLINQCFKNSSNEIVVHKSPVLEKKGRASRRYKVIFRIKCAPKKH